MGDIVERIRIEADGSQATAESSKVEKSLTGILIKSQLAAAALTKVFSVLVGELKKGLAATIEYERTTIARDAALRAQMPGMEKYVGLLEMQANAMEAVSGISDETIRSMQTLAVNVGVSADRVGDFVNAAVAMANVTGGDARTALEQLAKTQSGVIDRTMKLIPGISSLTKEQLASGKAIDLVNKEWGQFVDLQTRGGVGEITKLSTAWGNFAESIARAAGNTGLLTGATRDLTSALSLASRFIDEGSWGLAFSALFGAGSEGRKQMAAGLAKEDADNIAAEKAQLAGDAPMQVEGLGVEVASAKTREAMAKQRQAALEEAVKFANDLVEQTQYAADESVDAFNATLEAETDAFQSSLDDRVKIQEANAAYMLELEQRKQDGLAEIRDGNLKREIELTNKSVEDQTDAYDSLARSAQGAFGIVLDTGVEALEALVTGSEVSAAAVAQSLLKGIGKWLIGRGTSDVMEGTGRALKSYGADPSAYGLIGLGTAEISAGLGMMAGSAAMGGGGAGGGGGGAYSGGDARTAQWSGSADTGGGISGSRATGGGDGGERRITIVVDGNLSPAETGAWINKALAEAMKEGLVT
jgi:hypothetical protein